MKTADVSMKSVDILTLKELSAHDQRIVSLDNETGSKSEVDVDNISADGVVDKLDAHPRVTPKIEIIESEDTRSEIESGKYKSENTIPNVLTPKISNFSKSGVNRSVL